MKTQELEDLIKLIKSKNCPPELDLSNKKIDDAQAKTIAKALKENTIMHTLKLQYNKIGDEGAAELAKALEKNTTLCILDLGNNPIGLSFKHRFGISEFDQDECQYYVQACVDIQTIVMRNREIKNRGRSAAPLLLSSNAIAATSGSGAQLLRH